MKILNIKPYKPSFGEVKIDTAYKNSLSSEEQAGIDALTKDQENNHDADIFVSRSGATVRAKSDFWKPLGGAHELKDNNEIHWHLYDNGVYISQHSGEVNDKYLNELADKYLGMDLAAAHIIANDVEQKNKKAAVTEKPQSEHKGRIYHPWSPERREMQKAFSLTQKEQRRGNRKQAIKESLLQSCQNAGLSDEETELLVQKNIERKSVRILALKYGTSSSQINQKINGALKKISQYNKEHEINQ